MYVSAQAVFFYFCSPVAEPPNTAVVELRLGPGTRSLGTQEGQAQSRPGWPCLLSHASHQGKQKTWRGARGHQPPPEALCFAALFPPFYKFSESPLHRK